MTNPIVLVPGLNCTDALFAPQLAAFSGTHPIQVADHRRHDTIEAIASELLGTAPPHFILAGLSMGGYVALAVMRLAPDRVRGLVLMDTSARPDTGDAKARRDRLIAIADGGRFGEIADLHLQSFVAPSRLGDERLTAIIRRMAADTGPEAYVRQQRAIMARADSRPFLASISCPTLVMVGAEDVLTPPDLAREIAEGIPSADLAIIPGAGHLPTLEAPDRVNSAMDHFLTRIEF